MSHNDFIMDKKGKKPIDGFVPEILESIGYGTDTAEDPKTNKTGLLPIPTRVQVGGSGKERIVDNPHCYAKAIRFEGDSNHVYYIRMNGRGDVSDPWGLYQDNLQNSRMASHRGTAEYEFRRVDEQIFLLYLRYLAGRNNKSLLRLCERGIKDA